MAKELEKVPAIAHSNKSNKTVSTKNTSKTDSTKKATFNADANTLKEMQENVTVLQQKLNGLDVHSDQFKEVAKDIDFWKRKIEDVNRGFELGSITDYEKQIKGINDVLQNANLTETQRNKLVKERAKLEETIKSKEVKGYANGSISDLNEQKNNIQKRLTNENLTIDTRLKLITKVNDLQECIDNISDFTTIKVKKVTVENQNKLDSFDNAQSMIDTIIKQRQLGIIDKDTAIKQIEDIKT
ncbi:hypothetical protein [Prevotella sp.]|uniref:hypothetical protein n=1 Tax=Prevotella sp. TaxID=59823 RepID=UPI002F94CB88